jgi:uncharacterized protein (DUF983 family)
LSFGTMLGRALRRRCPNCGERRIWKSWFNTKDACPRCGLHFEREQGYWVMAIVMNTAFVEAIFGLGFVAGLIATWPEPEWRLLLVIGLVTNGVLPFLLFPFSKTVWVAPDLKTHPLPEGVPEER